jgi:DNA-binding beta-propeller fold protein YncE
MVVQVGSGIFTYEALPEWQQLPDGMTLHETPGVSVDASDNVYLLTRNTENPLIALDREGCVLRVFGTGTFTGRTHAVTVAPDGSLFCADNDAHTITKWSPEGELLLTIGTPGQPSPRYSGLPFNRPTDVAVSHTDGSLFISDGYANARVHHYSPEGELLHSWGEPGIDPGQFMIPHNIAIDTDDRIYVADREAHRVQVFDTEGNVLAIWNNIHRPCGLTVGPDGNIYIGELNTMVGLDMDGAPNQGHRVSVLNPEGELLARLGDPEEGEGPGYFIAPHGIAVDSHGDVYVGEVSYTQRGSKMDPPRELASLKKLRRIDAGG